MEEVLDLYEEPYDPLRPVVCFDERPCQLIGDVREPLPMKPAHIERFDSEYERGGVCWVLMSFEPLSGWRELVVTERRRKREFAHSMRRLAEDHYPKAQKIRVVLDNLSTHTAAAFYESFPAQQARRLARRIEFIYTPVHGSWLNMVTGRIPGSGAPVPQAKVDRHRDPQSGGGGVVGRAEPAGCECRLALYHRG